MRFSVDRLNTDHIPENVALARLVGWRDVASDWRVLHRAAVVLGVHHEGQLVAQGALGLYGHCGTVAKMIVHPGFQRRGLGQAVLSALLDEATDRSMSVLGLVATPEGRPLYEKNGFAHVGDVVVLTGHPRLQQRTSQVTGVPKSSSAALLDEARLGCTRRQMLQGRFDEAIVTAAVVGPSGSLTAFALATDQGNRLLLGPVVAEEDHSARRVTEAVMQAASGEIRIDVPSERSAFTDWLKDVGLREEGVRAEMVHGAPRLPWQVPQRFALAAQAWG